MSVPTRRPARNRSRVPPTGRGLSHKARKPNTPRGPRSQVCPKLPLGWLGYGRSLDRATVILPQRPSRPSLPTHGTGSQTPFSTEARISIAGSGQKASRSRSTLRSVRRSRSANPALPSGWPCSSPTYVTAPPPAANASRMARTWNRDRGASRSWCGSRSARRRPPATRRRRVRSGGQG
jgi:hypothetical protein